jgi:hypothetical protein
MVLPHAGHLTDFPTNSLDTFSDLPHWHLRARFVGAVAAGAGVFDGDSAAAGSFTLTALEQRGHLTCLPARFSGAAKRAPHEQRTGIGIVDSLGQRLVEGKNFILMCSRATGNRCQFGSPPAPANSLPAMLAEAALA